jgi:hypothetical protein
MGFARSAEIAPSEPSPAERLGPQFLYGWSQGDVDTVRRALAKMDDENIARPGGYDDYLLARGARILNKLTAGRTFYDENWKEMRLTMLGPDGEPWWIVHMTLPEIILTGHVVSRDRYCLADDQDTDDWHYLDAVTACEIHNTAAIELFERIANSKHMTPGGSMH